MSTTSPLPLRQRIDGPVVCLLVAVALVRPLFSITGWSDALGKPATPLLLTVAITLVWVLVAAFGRVRDPVATLVCTGVAYAVVSIVGSAILSPLLTGELQGPLANPAAILPMFLLNALWGAVCGLGARALRRPRR